MSIALTPFLGADYPPEGPTGEPTEPPLVPYCPPGEEVSNDQDLIVVNPSTGAREYGCVSSVEQVPRHTDLANTGYDLTGGLLMGCLAVSLIGVGYSIWRGRA